MTELPSELRELIAAERGAPIGVSRAALRARIAASVGAAPLGAAAAGASLAGGAKILAVVALIVGAGTMATLGHGSSAEPVRPPVPAVATAAAVAKSAPPRVEARVDAPPVVVPTGVQDVPAVAPAPRHAEILASPAPAPTAAPAVEVADAPVVSTPAIIVASQAELLSDAWTARDVDPARALALVTEDEHRHPDGALSEERDALHISVLAKLGRLDDARTAAAQFFTRHPDSIHRALIEQSIAAPTQPHEEIR